MDIKDPIFLGSFTDLFDVLQEFDRPANEFRYGGKILLAAYEMGDYDGEAWVVFQRGGKLYEVYGAHCSCNGLEDCWNPEETSLEAIHMRPETYYDTYPGLAEFKEAYPLPAPEPCPECGE